MPLPQTELSPAEKIQAWATANSVTLRTEFVPFSKSRNATPKKGENPWRSLNWRVWLQSNGRDVAGPFDYSAGVANCPSYKQRETYEVQQAVAYEIEQGKAARQSPGLAMFRPGAAIEPKLCDVLSSLALDADVLHAGSFDEWASDIGMDSDSISAKATFDTCVGLSLALVRAFGLEGVQALRQACEGY